VATITRAQLDALTNAVRHTEYLVRLCDEVERLHRVVFHDNPRADWNRVRASAEQILIAEIVSRYGGRCEGVLEKLRSIQQAGRTWEAALRELAAAIHSYYTTPLGIVMRQDLFGEAAVFVTPDAYEWTDQNRGTEAAGMPAGEAS